MQVLHVCSEMFPLLKTGGLADVLGALPAEAWIPESCCPPFRISGVEFPMQKW